MLRRFKRLFGKLQVGLVVGALAATAIGPAMPAAAQTAPTAAISFDQANYNAASVAAGNAITVNVNATTTGTVRGWQFGLSWNPAILSLTNVAYTDTFLNSQRPTGATVFNTAGTIDNTAGTLSNGGDAYLGGTGGATGTGLLATLTFHALALGTAGLTFTSTSHLVDATGVNMTTTLNTANVNVGPVAAPDLTVQNAATAAASTPAGTTFNVTFTIANIGTATSGVASVAGVAVTNATPATGTAAVPILAAGANSGTLTVGPFTLAAGQTLSNVTITADSTNVVTGNLRSSPTATSAYSFAAFTSSGQTPINATYAGFLRLTAPGLENTNLSAGQNNEFGGTSPTDDLNVRSNLSSWSVTAAGDNTGHFHEFDPGTSTYVATGGQLVQALNVHTGTTVPQVTLSGSPQTYVSGTRASSNPTTGNTYTITYDQFVGFNDQPVNPPHTYHIVITWAAAGTF